MGPRLFEKQEKINAALGRLLKDLITSIRIFVKRDVIAANIIISTLALGGMSVWAEDATDKAVRLNNTALAVAKEGRFEEAEDLFRSALAAKADDLTRAKIGNNLAWLYRRQDRYVDAEEALRRVLQWRQRSLPPDSAEVAYSMNNLAEVYRIEERNWEARNLMEAALRILSQSHPEAAELASVRGNLAVVLFKFQEYDQAESLLKSALADVERMYGGESRDAGIAANNLAQVLRLKNDFADAEPLYSRAARTFEKLGPAAAPDLAVSLANLGELLAQEHETQEAMQTEQRALDLLSPEGNAPLRANILQTLGNIVAGSGQPGAALNYFEQSLNIRDKVLGTEHPGTIRLLFDYAAATVHAGQKSLANKLRKRAETLLTQVRAARPGQFTVSLESLREEH
jgi:tetratricopeptide (TPR) repeat protein